MNDQENMMNAVYTNGFAVDEARLFLDTHPDSKEAMDYYQQKIELYQKAMQNYEATYGPISQNGGIMDGRWAWAENPFPWEGGM